MSRSIRSLGGGLLVVAVPAGFACFDASTRWEDVPLAAVPGACTVGLSTCASDTLQTCAAGPNGPAWVLADDCAGRGLVCAQKLLQCTSCIPDARACSGQDVVTCTEDGKSSAVVETCDASEGEVCRGSACTKPCELATMQKSNVGCEYWAVDLDNAMINATSNAAAQQFAVVVSNVQPDVVAEVTVWQDDGAPGDAPAPHAIGSALIAPLNLQVFKLGPREVDGSPEGEYNTGTHTALTRHAYKVTSTFPVVAYQFNPLENANVFSNDASLLKPREAIAYGGEMQKAYVVAGWPQTIAATDDPETNFNPQNPIHLRAFLTIVGTREDTHVRIVTKAAVVPGGPVAETPKDGTIEATLGAFDVLNLETGDFGADFTGSVVEADGPIAVFSGSEASDAPHFTTLAERRCCADHLEEQLDPIRTAGRTFALAHSPKRTKAVTEAGGATAIVDEPDYVRFVSAGASVTVKTTLPPPDDAFTLDYLGDFHEVTAYRDFMAEADHPIVVEQVMATQDACGVKRGLPGGDPSILIVPPIEQYRPDYTFLTPDKYAFDFVSIVAPPEAKILLDDRLLGPDLCVVTPADGLTADERGAEQPPLVAYQCQLGFPTIDALANPPLVLTGTQNDGVHRLVADHPVGVTVSGWDNYVSYAYAGGTDLEEIAVPE